ncbi:MAG: hypothetical protein D3923_02750 [Candidatus Electrothrix sp. AR3]|nr:hypothetical protein [Candidatus Electrothrix sp. AR3]
MSTDRRSAKLDERLQQANLSLADKIELLKRLSPPNDLTGESEEIRMERLLLSIAPEALPFLKYSVDYDGDYKDMVEYILHDIDDQDHQKALIEHFAKTAVHQGAVKVLSDVDDTMYANLVDERYPKKIFYPGVLAFYAALANEPFAHQGTPITTLSARPNPIGGIGEEGSINGIIEKTKGQLCPTGLSGEVFSSLVGTGETGARKYLERLQRNSKDELGKIALHANEDNIGKVKFANFAAYALIYPDYHFVFIGDSGQADGLTAAAMVSQQALPCQESTIISCQDIKKGRERVLTSFIHDLGRHAPNNVNSHSFRNLDNRLKTTAESANPHGIIVFRNYIEAATVATAFS